MKIQNIQNTYSPRVLYVQGSCKKQGSSRHSDAKNLILTYMQTWHLGSRWCTSDLHRHHCHL